MYELEIMVTGYTIAVVTASTVISKCIYKNQLNKIKKELHMFKSVLQDKEADIKQLKKALEKSSSNII